MTVTIKGYGKFPYNLMIHNYSYSFASTDLKIYCCLLSSTYSFSAAHENYGDLTNELGSGSGYTAGGCECTGKTVTYDTRVTTFDCNNPQWTSSTLTARFAVFYDNTVAGSGNKKLLCCVDFGSDFSSSASTLEIVVNASGLFTITVPA